jgi:hypothetical protein
VRFTSAGTGFNGNITWASTTTVSFVCIKTDGTYGQRTGITNLIPATWTTNDEIGGTFVYEAA